MIQQYVCKRNGKQIEGGKSEEKKKIEEEEKEKKNLLMLRCLRPRTQILKLMLLICNSSKVVGKTKLKSDAREGGKVQYYTIDHHFNNALLLSS